jgi:hypothetical protein
MSQQKICSCGDPNCWTAGDYSWLYSQSGWFGVLHGCRTSIFFIHGRHIREQRTIPDGDYSLNDLPRLLEQWSTGLPNARLCWCRDTGDGDASLWIEGERQPEPADLERLEEARQRERTKDERELERLKEKLAIEDFGSAPTRTP